VVLLHHLGLEDEQMARVGWWDLDRTLQPDHLTSLFIPEVSPRAELEHEMDRLERLVADPEEPSARGIRRRRTAP
jgi:uncharacterized protein YabN with tetrapyrrole methylase and pyrophosphatase domain